MKPQPEVALAVIRVAVGAVFCWHGWQALFTTGLPAVTQRYEATGVPLPLLTAPITVILGLLGGLLLVLGLGARALAGALALSTALVSGAATLNETLPPQRLELAILLLAGSLAVLVGGAGSSPFGGLRRSAPLPPSRRARRHKD